MSTVRRACGLLVLVWVISASLHGQVTSERILRAADEPQNWLTYSGGYANNRYSLLRQITAANVKNLELKWIFQAQSLEKFEATPLVVEGIMYVSQAPKRRGGARCEDGAGLLALPLQPVARCAPVLWAS